MNITRSTILRAARVAKVDPDRLEEVLKHPPDLPDHLLDRKKWVDGVTDFIIERPMETNVERLVNDIYRRFVLAQPVSNGECK